MNIIKKMFPKYESKNEMKNRLEKRIAFLEGWSTNTFIQINRDIIQVGASIEMGEREIVFGVPTDIMKRQLIDRLSNEIAPLVEYDIQDSEVMRSKLMTGRIYVSTKR